MIANPAKNRDEKWRNLVLQIETIRPIKRVRKQKMKV